MNLNNLFTRLYKNYGEHPGKMLLHTGTVGWILSCAAQTAAILGNDKISPEQKTFLIPQELADGAVNICSFYLLTHSVNKLCTNMVKNGKIANKAIKNYIAKNDLTDKVGKRDFKISQTEHFLDIKEEYVGLKAGVDVLSSTVGSIISCNLLTPVLRNDYASKQQRIANNYLQKPDGKNKSTQPYKTCSMRDFQNAVLKYASGQTKI